jgi:hypothetical protein
MKKSATKSSKKPSIKRQQIIVLEDGAGNYYELSRATLERSRVSEECKKQVAARLQDVPQKFLYIPGTAIPGSVAAPEFKGGRQLHYAGFYLNTPKAKR